MKSWARVRSTKTKEDTVAFITVVALGHGTIASKFSNPIALMGLLEDKKYFSPSSGIEKKFDKC